MAIGNKTDLPDRIPDKMKFHYDKNIKVTQGKKKGKIFTNTILY